MLINMKKKLLFVIPEYSIGGTNTSLNNLLSFIDKDKYDVSVYCLYEDGAQYFKDVFKPYILPKSRLYYWLHDNVFTRKFMGFLMKISSRFNFNWLYKREVKMLQKKYGFNCIIAYQEGSATDFVMFAKKTKKIAWIHSPYIDPFKNNGYYSYSRYSQFDSIACVSKDSIKNFTAAVPGLIHKISCIYNTLNNSLIREMGNADAIDIPINDSVFSIITIGRFCESKQFHKIPKIIKNINELGVSKIFKWYFITSGDEYRNQTIAEIKKYGVDDYIVMLGAKENPYPYLKNADLYVCTSEFESFSYVIGESKILHTPLVSNDFPVSTEVIDDSTGWICNINEMSSLIADIINDKNGIYSAKKDSIASYNYDNTPIMKDFYRMVD